MTTLSWFLVTAAILSVIGWSFYWARKEGHMTTGVVHVLIFLVLQAAAVIVLLIGIIAWAIKGSV